LTYDICVIGGGPGGYSAAIKGAQLGGKVALVEKDLLGGTCLNHGCIPTKNLYTSSELIRKIDGSKEHGVNVAGYSLDFSKTVALKNEVVKKLRDGLYRLFKEHRIELFNGAGSLAGEGKVQISSPAGADVIEAKKIILATGSEAADLSSLRIDRKTVLSNREILSLSDIPGSIIIVGGGAIGCEFANIFSRMGSKVTVVEMLDRILPQCEKEISRLVKKSFEEMGIELINNQSVVSSSVDIGGASLVLSDNRSISAEKILVSIGRRPNTSGLNLEEAGIEMDKGAVKTSSRMETSARDIYAAGDINGKMALAHVAAQEGKVAAKNAMGVNAEMDYSVIPSAVFVHPETASVGIGEEKLKKEGTPYVVGRFPYLANGKAVAMREEGGFVKVLASKADGRALGIHIAGAHASDLIGEAALAMKTGCTVDDISDTIHAHPTLSEALLEAWEDTKGMAIHKKGRRQRA